MDIDAIETIDYNPHNDLSSDKGPAQDQTHPDEISGMTNYLFISLQTQQNDKSEQGKISCLY
jgi:hypothetical protein